MAAQLQGLPAAPGLAIGPAVVLRRAGAATAGPVAMPVAESDTVTAARFEADAGHAERAGRGTQAEVLKACAMLARDPALAKGIAQRTQADADPAQALLDAGEELAARRPPTAQAAPWAATRTRCRRPCCG